MALPKQVQAALDAADAALAVANGQQTVPMESAPLDVVPPDPFAQSLPQPEVAPVAPPVAPAEEPWAKRYEVLRGKYDAEVPRLHHQVRELETSLRQVTDRMDAESKAKERAPEQPLDAEPKDIENFGADLVEMVGRVSGAAIGQAARVFDAKISKFEAQLSQLTQTIQGTNQQIAVTAEEMFFNKVTKIVPNWADVNEEPGFLAWLDEVDPVYGFTRRAALQKAQQGLNAEHAAAVFMAYLGPNKPAPKVRDPLDSQVSPKGAATVTPQAAEKPVIYASQVTRFYDDVRKGEYRGNEAEVARIESMINAALSEGRVREG